MPTVKDICTEVVMQSNRGGRQAYVKEIMLTMM